MLTMDNYINVSFKAIGENEALARLIIGAFASSLDPTLDDLADIKTSVSEAVTNAIIHAYDGEEKGDVDLFACIHNHTLQIIIQDHGKGIEDIEKAKEPLYTSKPECDRSGMGFTIMESFMDSLEVESVPQKGTRVTLTKDLSAVCYEEYSI